MSFAHPDYFQWLFVLPLLIFIYAFRSQVRKKKVKKWLGSQSHFLMSSISPKKRWIKLFLQTAVLALVLIALARPQSQGEKVEARHKGLYILLLVDASHSMLAEDVQPSRLAFMKKELSRLIHLSGGDQMALGIFAHSTFLAVPFTNDLSTVQSYLNELSTDHLTNQGTNFERAFRFSDKLLKKIKQDKYRQPIKAIVMASDGEDHSKKTKQVIKKMLSQKNVRIFTLSFGTEEGGVIPIKDYKGAVKEYKKDIQGDLVITRLKKQALKKFAKWGKGAYYHVTYGGQAIERLRKDLDLLEKNRFEKTSYIQKKEGYQWLLILAFLIAVMEWALNDRSYKKNKKQNKL